VRTEGRTDGRTDGAILIGTQHKRQMNIEGKTYKPAASRSGYLKEPELLDLEMIIIITNDDKNYK